MACSESYAAPEGWFADDCPATLTALQRLLAVIFEDFQANFPQALAILL